MVPDELIIAAARDLGGRIYWIDGAAVIVIRRDDRPGANDLPIELFRQWGAGLGGWKSAAAHLNALTGRNYREFDLSRWARGDRRRIPRAVATAVVRDLAGG